MVHFTGPGHEHFIWGKKNPGQKGPIGTRDLFDKETGGSKGPRLKGNTMSIPQGPHLALGNFFPCPDAKVPFLGLLEIWPALSTREQARRAPGKRARAPGALYAE